MKIGINLTPYTSPEVGGLGVYVQSIIQEFSNDSTLTIKLFIKKDTLKILREQNKLKHNVIIVEVEQDLYADRLSRRLEELIEVSDLDIWYCPFLVADPIRVKVHSVVLIPDMQHEELPDMMSSEILSWRRFNYESSAVVADKIITLSEYSKKMIEKFLFVPQSKIEVTNLDAPFWFNDIGNADVRKLFEEKKLTAQEYLFFPANTWPHKNHTKLIEAFNHYSKEFPTVKLLFSGESCNANKDLVNLIEVLGLSDRVVFLGYVENEIMPLIFKNALAMVYPSLYEGFGIPLVEALRCNCPIIASNVTSIPEVGEDACLYFDPRNAVDIYEKMKIITENSEIRNSLKKKGASQARKYDYKETARKTLEIFKNVIKSSSSRDNNPLKFSIITPSFAQGKFIGRTIDSVLNQKYPNTEYWVIDGGSKDETVNVLKEYSDKINWVSEKDNGQTDAINKGIRKVNGDIIAYLNSDDTYEPDIFNFVSELFKKNPHIDIIFGKGKHIDEDDIYLKDYLTYIANDENLSRLCPICQPTVFIRKTLVDKVGLFDENFDYAMDYEYWLRLNQLGYHIYFVNEYLANSRLHIMTKTLGSSHKVHMQAIELQTRYFGKPHFELIASFAFLKYDFNLIVNKKKFERLKIYYWLIFKFFFNYVRFGKALPKYREIKSVRDTLLEWLNFGRTSSFIHNMVLFI